MMKNVLSTNFAAENENTETLSTTTLSAITEVEDNLIVSTSYVTIVVDGSTLFVTTDQATTQIFITGM